MKKFIIVGICCALPLIILAIIVFSGQKATSPQSASNPSTSNRGQEIPAVGNLFPDFSLTEVSGKEITRDSLKGKPTIVWFTASFCVPCQIGARSVSKLDNDLGGSAFNVVVVFVDPRETSNDLTNWRSNFANADWLVVMNNGLAERIGLKYLDSKFILDKNGVVKNIDFSQADENYLNTIKQIVKEN